MGPTSKGKRIYEGRRRGRGRGGEKGREDKGGREGTPVCIFKLSLE